jgi:hypothetical protein
MSLRFRGASIRASSGSILTLKGGRWNHNEFKQFLLNTTKSQELGEKLIVVTNLRHQSAAEEARGGDEIAAKYVEVSESEAEQAD